MKLILAAFTLAELAEMLHETLESVQRFEAQANPPHVQQRLCKRIEVSERVVTPTFKLFMHK